jgi:3-dehydroquinate dehydratase-2
MPKILVVHGAGMNMRGKSQLDVFGPMTLPQYDEHIRKYAAELGVEVEIFHSNIEGEVIDKFYEAHDRGVDGAIINPAGYSTGHPALTAAISQVRFPTFELHISNPARRGRISEVGQVARGVVTGFGIFGYYLALRGLKEVLASAK